MNILKRIYRAEIGCFLFGNPLPILLMIEQSVKYFGIDILPVVKL